VAAAGRVYGVAGPRRNALDRQTLYIERKDIHAQIVPEAV